MGLRNTIGVVLPVIIGAAVHEAAAGMIAGVGALNVAAGDGTDPYSHRARRMLMASLFGSIAVLAGGLAAGTHWSALILAVAAFVAGMMVSLGPAPADIGVITLVTLIVFSARPFRLHEGIVSGMLALGGGLFQTLLAVAFWPLGRNLPERRALSSLYMELARVAASGTTATEAPPASRESTAAQQAMATLDARDSIDAERYLALLSQAERVRLVLLTLSRLRIRIGREEGTQECTALLDRFLGLASQVFGQVGEVLMRKAGGVRLPGALETVTELAEKLRSESPPGSSAVAVMIADVRVQVDALAGQLRAILDLAAQTTPLGRAEFERLEAAHPWKLRFTGILSALVSNLHLESAAFRHAIRLAVSVTAGDVLARGLGWQRPYWVPMTIALVLKPDYMATFSRGIQRLLGTLLGLMVATALFHFLQPSLAWQILFIALFTFLLRSYGPANYGIIAFGVTGLIVFLFAYAGISPSDVVLSRGLNTFGGGLIALIIYRVWPTWERKQLPEALARMLDSYRMYFQSVCNGYLKQAGSANGVGEDRDRIRLAGRIARADLEASVARLRGEPGTPGERIAMLDRILANSHRLIHAVMSLEAGLLTSAPVPARDAFRKLSNDVDLTLYYLAAFLNGSSTVAAFPDLREDHHALLESGDSRIGRYALVNIETDRIVNSLNTLTAEILAFGSPKSAN